MREEKMSEKSIKENALEKSSIVRKKTHEKKIFPSSIKKKKEAYVEKKLLEKSAKLMDTWSDRIHRLFFHLLHDFCFVIYSPVLETLHVSICNYQTIFVKYSYYS